MSGKTFEDCVAEIEGVTDLKGLFKLWREAHKAEVEEIEEKLEELSESDKECEGNLFEHILYRGKVKDYENTISSHFIQFFYKENCAKCNRGKKISEKKTWKYVLENAFNMDGCYGAFELPKDGFKYICLLKEANDSAKVCVENYEFSLDKSKINEWILKEKGNANMLFKLNESFKIFFKNKYDSECKHFMEEMAYMNINKRGGTSSTQGVDQTAVINYAGRYHSFIWKEIEVLTGKQAEVTVFVCGKNEKYYTELINALLDDEKTDGLKKIEKNKVQYNGKIIKFVNITHPSSPSIPRNETGFKQLAKEMDEK